MKQFWNCKLDSITLENKDHSVLGTLTPITWDRKGRPIKFSVYSDDGEDFIIKEYRYKNRLRHLLNKRVQATGIVWTNKYGDKFIKLKKIKELMGPVSPTAQTPHSSPAEVWGEDFPIYIPQEYIRSGQFIPEFEIAS